MIDSVKRLAPLPLVDLRAPALPSDGLLFPTPSTCHRHFDQDGRCRAHYAAVREGEPGTLVQCPFGFATRRVRAEGLDVALTAFVPAPRLGGSKEKRRTKDHPETKTPRYAQERAADVIGAVAERVRDIERETVKQLAMGLHEIRKLNARVKRSAERLCRQQRPDAPDRADTDLVRIWKSADLMSRQFDIVEILANEDLARIEPKSIALVYPLFDKCVRILRLRDEVGRLTIEPTPPDYRPEIRVSDKTIAIIPTVLIDNALRYGVPGTPVTVRVEPDGPRCKVSVTNVAPAERRLDPVIFEKGARGDTSKDGSGNGLYLAQLVAEQHGTSIELEQRPAGDGHALHSFIVRFETLT